MREKWVLRFAQDDKDLTAEECFVGCRWVIPRHGWLKGSKEGPALRSG